MKITPHTSVLLDCPRSPAPRPNSVTVLVRQEQPLFGESREETPTMSGIRSLV